MTGKSDEGLGVKRATRGEFIPGWSTPSTMVQVTPPIVAYENSAHDVTIFPSVEAAETYIEPWDVLNQEYTIYDSEGRLLRALVPEGRVENWVKIRAVEPAPRHADELREVLTALLRHLEAPDAAVRGSGLEELVARASAYVSAQGASNTGT